ncbi:hypothetical protein MNBD_PLANCTO02-1914 [hydrothermal vent metagenome]|uniref:Uncharacterized protein n=1 Tax=hydrothermal vent metagenome TaxID=652676 RepID=A0A3B1DAU6_9ZZZZ
MKKIGKIAETDGNLSAAFFFVKINSPHLNTGGCKKIVCGCPVPFFSPCKRHIHDKCTKILTADPLQFIRKMFIVLNLAVIQNHQGNSDTEILRVLTRFH